jgi:hypothetical protein
MNNGISVHNIFGSYWKLLDIISPGCVKVSGEIKNEMG